MSVVTRFAPSPTGYLHIGGARTALFNWLYARRMGGAYLLRIEDTDRVRSTQGAIDAILDGLRWLDLLPDGEITYQYARAARHREVAQQMIDRGTAFRCYMTTEEIDAYRKNLDDKRPQLKALRDRVAAGHEVTWDDVEALTWDELDVPWDELEDSNSGLEFVTDLLNLGFRSIYRDGRAPPRPDAHYVVRLRAPDADDGDVVNDDLVQGEIRIRPRTIDDLVLLRADGNPTYMLSVVVDDHDMGVTHVIRGDDHLTNAARQIPIFQAMGWTPPHFAHVPLIHGEDGKKLSKRHGAQAVHEWREMGYLPEGMNAYLMRLGWSPGHDDILTKEEAVPQFDVTHIGKAPSRLDFAKLDSVNAHFMHTADDARLLTLVREHIAAHTDWSISPAASARLEKAIGVLKTRAKTVKELADQARFLIVERPIQLDASAQKAKDQSNEILLRLRDTLADAPSWTAADMAGTLKAFATEAGVGMGKIGPGLRAALTGGAPAPDLGQVLEFLGREETLGRLSDQL